MRAFIRRYGAHPLNLLALIASFALAAYAARLLVHSNPVGVIVWFVGAAIGHDLLLLPLYVIADGRVARLWRRHPGRLPTAPWINYLRAPALLSGLLLLLVYLPSIARLSGDYQAITGLSSAGYLNRWLAVTGVLFLISALVFAIQLRRKRIRSADADAPASENDAPAPENEVLPSGNTDGAHADGAHADGAHVDSAHVDSAHRPIRPQRVSDDG